MKGLLSSLLALVLLAPAPAWCEAPGSIDGRVVPVDGAPEARAVFVAAKGGADVRRVPVAADGSFAAQDLPAGPVALAVETASGLYTVDTPITLAPGTRRSVSLALRGRQDSNTPPREEKEKKRKPGGIWNNPLTASLIVIGAAVVVGIAVDQLTKGSSKTPTASASQPGD